jgi:hypothetical protein
MLEKARERAARRNAAPVRLLQMDAADLKFADDSFDIVYAPYLISVVPDPSRSRRRCTGLPAGGARSAASFTSSARTGRSPHRGA